MRIQLIAIALLLGCQAPDDLVDTAPASHPPLLAAPAANTLATSDNLDAVKQIFDEVDGDHIIQLMRDLSGVDPVMIDGQLI
ncbi:MAG: hypothetical protein E6J90_51220, partial [Deltaproteobacteria bacterium]